MASLHHDSSNYLLKTHEYPIHFFKILMYYLHQLDLFQRAQPSHLVGTSNLNSGMRDGRSG